MANIQGDNYRVWYEEKINTVYFEGTLRLRTIAEYSPILQLLTNVINDSSGSVNIHFENLYLLNSSGISMLYKFIVDTINKQKQVMITASNSINWQSKVLIFLQKLVPKLMLIYDSCPDKNINI